MNESLRLPLLFALIFGLCFWRVALPLCVALAAAWLVSVATPLNTAYLSYALVVIGLVAGVVWQVRAGRQKTQTLREGGKQRGLPSVAGFSFLGVLIAASLEWAMGSPVTVIASSIVTSLVIAFVGQPQVRLNQQSLVRAGAFLAGSVLGLALAIWFLA